jgi:F0F1-type ATP synthase assembly protein I
LASPDPSPRRESAFLRYAKFSSVAFEFVGCIAAGVFVGNALDAWLQTAPWLILVMTIAGTVIGFYRMIQILRQFQRNL